VTGLYAAPSSRHLSVAFPVKVKEVEAQATAEEEEEEALLEEFDEPTERQVTFEDIKDKLDRSIFRALTQSPFQLKTPSPVQTTVFDHLPDVAEIFDPNADIARDLLTKAKTSTGKTLAFLIPAVQQRLNWAKNLRDTIASRSHREESLKSVGTLIISPTRELATQIAAKAQNLCEHTPLEVKLFTEGSSRNQQLRSFVCGRRDIVVATPGRLLDLLSSEEEVKKSVKDLQLVCTLLFHLTKILIHFTYSSYLMRLTRSLR
jgi:ATP-dependent RNA helicase MSS116, mitochondrial